VTKSFDSTKPVGWTDSSGQAIKIQFSDSGTGSDKTYECRTAYKTEIANATWTSCSGSGYELQPMVGQFDNGFSKNNGTYTAQVRATDSSGNVLDSKSFDYYAHPRLNGKESCTPPFTDAQYFQAATAGSVPLDALTYFGVQTSVAGAIKTIEFRYSGDVRTMVSASKGARLNGDGTLLLVAREWGPKDNGSNSSDRCTMSVKDPYRHSLSMTCDALVMNARGNTLCFNNQSLQNPVYISRGITKLIGNVVKGVSGNMTAMSIPRSKLSTPALVNDVTYLPEWQNLRDNLPDLADWYLFRFGNKSYNK